MRISRLSGPSHRSPFLILLLTLLFLEGGLAAAIRPPTADGRPLPILAATPPAAFGSHLFLIRQPASGELPPLPRG